MVWPGNPLAETFAELTRHDLNSGVSADKTGPTNPSKRPEYPAPSAEPDWTREGAMWSGGAEGYRTPDLLIANEALSQLSYGPSRVATARRSARG